MTTNQDMKKRLLVLIISIAGHGAFGQQYITAVGVKGDWSSLDTDMAQLTLKHFFSGPSAFEINIGGGRRFVWLEGLYLSSYDLKHSIDWYFGGGIDLGYWNNNFDGAYDDLTHTGFWGGATGVFGIEYTTKVVPLNFALDFGPTLRFLPDIAVGGKIGFSTRYAFGANRK